MTSVDGYGAIRIMDHIFEKGTSLYRSSWDTAFTYNLNSMTAMFSQRLSNWSYASSRIYLNPMAWINSGTRSFEQARSPDEVAAQLAAFRKWGTGGAFLNYAFGGINNGFDYTPYVPAMQAAATPGVVDTQPPTLTIATATRNGATVTWTGSATDNLAIQAVRWTTASGASGAAQMNWVVTAGSYQTNYQWQMNWTATIPATSGQTVTITAADTGRPAHLTHHRRPLTNTTRRTRDKPRHTIALQQHPDRVLLIVDRHRRQHQILTRRRRNRDRVVLRRRVVVRRTTTTTRVERHLRADTRRSMWMDVTADTPDTVEMVRHTGHRERPVAVVHFPGLLDRRWCRRHERLRCSGQDAGPVTTGRVRHIDDIPVVRLVTRRIRGRVVDPAIAARSWPSTGRARIGGLRVVDAACPHRETTVHSMLVRERRFAGVVVVLGRVVPVVCARPDGMRDVDAVTHLVPRRRWKASRKPRDPPLCGELGGGCQLDTRRLHVRLVEARVGDDEPRLAVAVGRHRLDPAQPPCGDEVGAPPW